MEREVKGISKNSYTVMDGSSLHAYKIIPRTYIYIYLFTRCAIKEREVQFSLVGLHDIGQIIIL